MDDAYLREASEGHARLLRGGVVLPAEATINFKSEQTEEAGSARDRWIDGLNLEKESTK